MLTPADVDPRYRVSSVRFFMKRVRAAARASKVPAHERSVKQQQDIERGPVAESYLRAYGFTAKPRKGD